MSRVYIWQFSDKYRVFEGIDEKDDFFLSKNNLADFDGEWVVPALSEVGGRPTGDPLGDFPATTGFCHLVSQTACDAIGGYLEAAGELFEVEFSDNDVDEKYYLYQCRNIVDCLDKRKSRIKYSPIRPNKVSSIMDPVFIEGKVPDDQFFLVPENKGGHIYVPEVIKLEVKKSRLKGMVLLDKMFEGKKWIS